MNPLRNLLQTYQRTGRSGASVLLKYYAERARVAVSGPGRQCPICGWEGPEFHPLVYPDDGAWRRRAACPQCGSLERHRLLWFAYAGFLQHKPHITRTLHFAAERCFRPLLTDHSSKYFVSEYTTNAGDIRLDFDALGLRDGSIDLVLANSVLSCAKNHRRAVEELHRVLAPGGAALICDPFVPDGTMTEWTQPLFGVRRAFGGRDLIAAFAPFRATLVRMLESVPEADRERYGVLGGDFALIRLDKN